MPSSATGSPGLSAVTPAPTSATSPAISCPGQTDGIIIWSWYQCRSEPQMPQLRTRTTTSPGPGTGRGTSSTTSLPTARQKAARMVLISRSRRMRRDLHVRVLRREHLAKEAARRRRALQRRVEERGLHHLGETMLLVGRHGRVRRKRILAGERAAGRVDAGPPAAETLEDVALLRDAGDDGAADPIVALRGRAREVGRERGVRPVHQRDQRARRARALERARSVGSKRYEQVLIALQHEQRRPRGAVEALAEHASDRRHRERGAHPAVTQARVVGDEERR